LRAARDAVEFANPAGGRAERAEFLDHDIGRTAIYPFDCFMKEVRAMNRSMRRTLFVVAAGLACILVAGCAGKGIVAEGAKWEEISRAGRVFAEGVVAAKDGKLYMTDIMPTMAVKENNTGGTIWRYDPTTGKAEKYMEPSGMANGLHVDKNGDLLIAQGADTGGRAVLRRNLATGATTVVADSYQGKRLNSPNDITSDSQGRIYFTDARYISMDPMELPNAVYRVDLDGKITQIIADLFRPNGIEVSPDGRRLYVADNGSTELPINPNGPAKDRFGISGGGGVIAYDLDAKGNVSNGKVILRTEEVSADGMAMDTDGNLYVAMHNGNPAAPKADVVVLNPAGEMIKRLTPPAGSLTTNLGFGRGADSGTLYMTSALPWRLYRIKTERRGHYFN
jgi:gluconolactonase